VLGLFALHVSRFEVPRDLVFSGVRHAFGLGSRPAFTGIFASAGFFSTQRMHHRRPVQRLALVLMLILLAIVTVLTSASSIAVSGEGYDSPPVCAMMATSYDHAALHHEPPRIAPYWVRLLSVGHEVTVALLRAA